MRTTQQAQIRSAIRRWALTKSASGPVDYAGEIVELSCLATRTFSQSKNFRLILPQELPATPCCHTLFVVLRCRSLLISSLFISSLAIIACTLGRSLKRC